MKSIRNRITLLHPAHHPRAWFVLLLLSAFIYMIAWGTVRSSHTFHVDEMWQYSFSNSHGKDVWVLEQEQMGQWLSPTIFRDYLTVRSDERFYYSKVIESASRDVHPPLSFLLLNTISSFAPETFSKWYGLGINIAAYLLTICALYRLAHHLFHSHPRALAASVLWAFSPGAIDTVLYIRFYCLLTLFAVTSVLFTVQYFQNRSPRTLALVYASFILGGLTDYIFWILGFFLTLAFIITALRQAQRSLAAKYAATTFLSFVSACLLFPATITQFFQEDSISKVTADKIGPAAAAMSLLNPGPAIHRFLTHTAERIFFVQPATVYILLTLLAIHLAIRARKINWRIAPAPLLVILSTALTAYTIAAIFPDFNIWTSRAFFFIYPFSSLLLASILYFLRDHLRIPAFALVSVVAFLLLRILALHPSHYLQQGGDEQLAHQLRGASVVVTLDHPKSIGRLPNFCIPLSGANEVLVIPITREDYREQLLRAFDTARPDTRLMVLNLSGGLPENLRAIELLGPELLLTNDIILAELLLRNHYHGDIVTRSAHLFQWFSLYNIHRPPQ